MNGPNDPTHTDRFPVRTFTTLNPTYVQMEERDDDLYTAQVWTLHLNSLSEDVEQVTALGEALRLARYDGEPLITDYTGGDSFAQWAEPFYPGLPEDGPSDDKRALHVYFHAPDRAAAILRSRLICVLTTHPEHVAPFHVTLSTAADWSMQTEVWPNPARARRV